MTMEYVRRRYNVPAMRGIEIEYAGVPGRITSASHYIRAKLSNGERIRAHPLDPKLRYVVGSE